MCSILQEPVIEYVEGYEELEEEDDMEDFGGLAIREDYDNGKTFAISLYTVLLTYNIIALLLGFKLGERPLLLSSSIYVVILAISQKTSITDNLNDGDDDDDDDDDEEEKSASVAYKRGRKSSARKLAKEEQAAKSKKKIKVQVEVNSTATFLSLHITTLRWIFTYY